MVLVHAWSSEEGTLCLEDLRDKVTLVVTPETRVVGGLLTETSIVLVQGHFRSEDEVFVASVRLGRTHCCRPGGVGGGGWSVVLLLRM